MDKFRSKKLLAALVLLPVIFCIACAIAFRAICTHEVRTARFGQLEMYGESGNYISISSSQPAGCKLFVEIPDEGQFPIAAVPQEVLNRRFKKGEMKNRLWYEWHCRDCKWS